jgi:hypothetical protein
MRDSSTPAAGAGASAELADLSFQQPPAFAAKFLLPGRIDAGKTRAEGRLIDFVERNPARDEGVAQAGIELALLVPLLAHVFGGVPLEPILMNTEARVSRRHIGQPQLHPLGAVPAIEA